MSHKAPVVVIPVNGLGNRLRAISGSYALSLLHKRRLIVAWDSEPHLPDDVHELFRENDLIEFHQFADVVRAGLLPTWEIPLYFEESDDFLTLRGYDKGEQRFIAELSQKMERSPHKGIVIKAGDFFSPKASSLVGAARKLRRTRRLLYREILSAGIVAEGRRFAGRRSYIGVSLRGSDLSDRVPHYREILGKVVKYSRHSRVSEVYLSSESAELRQLAESELSRSGLNVRMNPTPTWIDQTANKSERIPISGRSALFDFVVLSMSRHYFGPKASTFVTEIAVTRPPRSSTLL